jgi:hypothetical protein
MIRPLLFASVALSTAMASSDMTVKTLTSIEDTRPNSSGGLAKSRTVHLENLFVQGDKLRRESVDPVEPGLQDFSFGQPRLVTIDRCDKGVQFLVNPVTRQYIRHKTKLAHHRVFLRSRRGSHQSGKAAWANASAYSSLSSETKDTGETREMFGLTARHFITRITRTPIGGSGPQEDVADGWFVNKAIFPRACTPAALQGGSLVLRELESSRPLGIPVQVRYQSTTPASASAQHHPILETNIIELSEQAIDSHLFEVPKGYKRVRHFRVEVDASTNVPVPLR